MTTSSVHYPGNLRTEATHTRSGNTILTDAPLDNHGRGEAFSPSDLLATSLLSCMMTVMGILADRKGWMLEGMQGTVVKEMGNDPRRVSGIIIELSIPLRNLTEKDQEMLRHTARTCPVALSLHPDIHQDIRISFVA
jgi:putative redox protein